MTVSRDLLVGTPALLPLTNEIGSTLASRSDSALWSDPALKSVGVDPDLEYVETIDVFTNSNQ